MTRKKHILVIDPTAFPGGSKIATENILKIINKNDFMVNVLTSDTCSWKSENINTVNLHEFSFLSRQELGVSFFIRHLFIALNILFLRLRYGSIDVALGASGPGVDLSIYLIQPLLRFKIVQLIHGSVACSRTIGKCLMTASSVHYLDSTQPSLSSALIRASGDDHHLETDRFKAFKNGLPKSNWPSPCQYEVPVLFWAASLLKWKGLDTFLNALNIKGDIQPHETNICFIRPKDTSLESSIAPVDTNNVNWFETPDNMDEIRRQSNIFVSSSHKEPFGLSVLEAMAAGHVVIIPEDGAYWDKVLTNEENCIKYQPGNEIDLNAKINYICENKKRLEEIGKKAAIIALEYNAEHQYSEIVTSLQNFSMNNPIKKDNTLWCRR